MLSAVASAAASGNNEAIERAAREGIGALSPIQLLPISLSESVASHELPPNLVPCVRPEPGMEDVPMLLEPFHTDSLAHESAECADVVTPVVHVHTQPYSFGLDAKGGGGGSVFVVSKSPASIHPWFSSVGSQQGFSYGDGRWTYRDAVGPSVALGNLTSNAPIWGSTVPIGGLQLSSGWKGTTDVMEEGAFAYSSSVGRLNYTDTSATSGALDYGVTASSGSLRYGLTPALTLESQLQGAPELATRGVGSTYSAGEFGTFQVGATNSNFHHVNAWRYRFGYNVNLTESLTLAVINEQVDPGFGDLSSYKSGLNDSAVMRNTLAAGMPVHGGSLTGTYTGTREHGVAIEQRFGLEHSRVVAPDVRLSLGGNRDVISGNYEVRAGIAMPVDAFLKGNWLHWK